MAAQSNPLLGWQGQTGVNVAGQLPTPLPQTTPIQQPNQAAVPTGESRGALTRAGQEENVQRGAMTNALIPQMSNAMMQTGTEAGNVFGQFANLGSPYYQQQQQASFTQDTQQAQNAAAQSRQQLGAQGYGFTPSGAEAGMLGGEAVGTAGNLSMNFLQNLFNNEQLQLQGAQGLASVASIFNPTGLATGQTSTQIYQPPTLASQLSSIMGSLSGAGASSASGAGATL